MKNAPHRTTVAPMMPHPCQEHEGAAGKKCAGYRAGGENRNG
jgi:hypothetical protein